MKTTVFIIELCISLLISGCDKIKVSEEYYNEQGGLVKMSDTCLSEIICQIPNTTEVKPDIPSHELCYDLINDLEDIRGQTDKVLKEHPNDWEEYIDWTPHKFDPKILFMTNNNVTEITCENVYIKR